MNKFGAIKNKILDKITKSYETDNKPEIKKMISLIKENRDFKEMYLFYENFENMYFDNKETASLYVEEIATSLKEKSKNISKFTKKLVNELKDVDLRLNPVYVCLDQLQEEDSLLTLDKKIIAKKWLVEYLTTPKPEKIEESAEFTPNQKLLHAILVNNFNVLFENSLSDKEKEELKKITSMPQEEIDKEVNSLKEDILSSTENVLSEANDPELIKKLETVRSDVKSMIPTKFNYYKLKELKLGLE